ncbi:DUF1064 domain-containing protein [Cohnella ginsengisoli]|uniref:DUF1064 domain-containing protein n=1 Tax=Cohnella ginsengisoli TaxID=425004 RepID=A0A9X4KHA1_9BACL|nr:DUF1064 domain-containing protein [Cohnella ginsengisoli]MDG0791936.1 DUF1064 domain-containing protein [Cohnella ginsengisoli]
MSKYGARKTMVDGHKFDSAAEARYYSQLKLLKRAGKIRDFILQPRYVLLDGYRHPQTGRKVRGVEYVADFLISYPDGSQEVVDVKGVRTEAYKIKKKLFESKYGIPIKEERA